MSAGSAEFSLPIRVYIEDTDAGGIVYYVNYLKYFERARTEFMRSLGYDKAALPEEDLMFVVSKASLQYRDPARLDELLEVTAQVISVGGATLTFVQSVNRAGECLVDGEVVIALVSTLTGRPHRLPTALRDRIGV